MKCTLCHPRVVNGQLPGCVESCPTEALIFGKRSELLRIARQRIADYPERYVNTSTVKKRWAVPSWLYLSDRLFPKWACARIWEPFRPVR
jgi:formate dehydrogenase iron-sulfur subunit